MSRRNLWVAIGLAACGAPVAENPRLVAARDREDVSAMRDHMWRMWAAITPGWTRWERSDPVLGKRDRVFRSLQPFRRDDGSIEAETLPIAFDVRFDKLSAAHIRDHQLDRRDHQQPFAEFPAGAIAVKAVWFAVKQRGLTAMPIWDGEPARADAAGNPDRTWLRTVLIDPEAGAVRRRGIVPLSELFFETLDASDVAAARAATHDSSLVPGDHVALVAMHVTAKEIREWTWATLWWHDRPDDGPYAAGRPASVTGVWRNYRMDVTFSSETPREPDGSSRACMNPWLEARFQGGLHSNCIACHQRAVVGAVDYLPVTRGPLRAGELGSAVQTDFVWSVALEAR